MALMESKVVRVANLEDVINASNELYGSFGWNVSNVQVTHTQSGSLEQSASQMILGA